MDILPEYDSFKYNSFAVNAGDLEYQLTSEIQQQITTLESNGELVDFPPILAFSSVVDATVSTPALVSDLFERLGPGGHEPVSFDVNHITNFKSLMKWDSGTIVGALQTDSDRVFTLSHLTNRDTRSQVTVHPSYSTIS